ncbi:uncharacterized protein LOC128762333 [Synchiropus splendidus]|uniref:uncharacterized protein LOC128762333 n=1 Tax=Synchiropus splendidus TaxID=270530 RepID=UPI00237E51AF|nr:uncharacterized protein LOC128762333 [Synchiropus splendidus]
MMENSTVNKSHPSLACQNEWSVASPPGPILNSLSGSQHLSLGSGTFHRSSYDHLQPPSHGGLFAPATFTYKSTHVDSSNSLFASSVLPSASHLMSFPPQNPLFHPTDKHVASHSSSPHHSLASLHDPFKCSYPILDQGLQGLPVNMQSCDPQLNQAAQGASHPVFEGATMEASGVSGYSHSNTPAHEQQQWIPPAGYKGTVADPLTDAAASAAIKEELQDGNSPLQTAKDNANPSTGLQQCAMLVQDLEDWDTVKVKQEYSSAESEDSETEPDFSPSSAEDLSDFLTDTEAEFSDYSNHSGFSSQEEETPGTSALEVVRVKPAVKSSSKKSKSDAYMNEQSSDVIMPVTGSKEQRVYDRRNYCLFCSKPMSKMYRHLQSIHFDKPEVAAAFQYPKHSKERQKVLYRLINQGNFAHNKEVLKSGKGQLAVRKRPRIPAPAEDFLHCLHCRGLFLKKSLSRHMKQCPEKNDKDSRVGRKRIASRCVLEVLDNVSLSEGFKGILSQMIYDDVTRTVLNDKIILQFGEQLFNQHGTDVKRHDYIRQNLRQLARLVIQAKKATPLRKLEDFFLPSSFQFVVAAVNVLAGYDPVKQTYSIPSLAIKLGYHLQKACNIVEVNAEKRGKQSLAESARKFLAEYQKNWNRQISSGALTTLRETKLCTDKKVPFAQDVKRLNVHMENIHTHADKKLRDCPTVENYAALAKVVLARIILFNRRKAGEVSQMPVKAFMSWKKPNPHEHLDIYVSDLERRMCECLDRVEIRGRCGRMVPVLLKPSYLASLELLVQVRSTCGIPNENPFLFARPTALSAYNGSACIQKFVKDCGADNPEALSSTKIRKHFATLLLMMNLDGSEASRILGPNTQVVGQEGIGLTDDQVALNGALQHPGPSQSSSWGGHSAANYGDLDFYLQEGLGAPVLPSRSAEKSKKGSKFKGKKKWDEMEVCAVERHMMRFIHTHKVPQKNDCIQCLEAEPQALRTRSWRGVKDYVRNRITALKRQGGTPQPPTANWSGHAEQPGAAQYQPF